MISSKICELIGIQYPIFQGGMAWISDAKLASAVSNAGGLGLISAMNANAEYVREEIKKCKTMTDKPFGVNIMLMSPNADDLAQLVIDEKVAVVTTGAGNPGYHHRHRSEKRRASRVQSRYGGADAGKRQHLQPEDHCAEHS